MSNNLTPAEIERLAMLAEECGEVVQIVCKVLRHGYESYHPDDMNKETNKDILVDELLDVFAVLWLMNNKGDIITPDVNAWLKDRVARKLKYSHCQELEE